jgi:hypothetical protein
MSQCWLYSKCVVFHINSLVTSVKKSRKMVIGVESLLTGVASVISSVHSKLQEKDGYYQCFKCILSSDPTLSRHLLLLLQSPAVTVSSLSSLSLPHEVLCCPLLACVHYPFY